MILLSEYEFANFQIDAIPNIDEMYYQDWITYYHAIYLILQYQLQELSEEAQVDRTKDN
jgi:hypothetical protein